jgi:hypothetical protein
MSSTKCIHCGLINFLAVEHCKRCKANLNAPFAPEQSISGPAGLTRSKGGSTPRRTDGWRSVSPLRILLLILVILGAGWYLVRVQDDRRAAEVKADKEMDQKLRVLDQKLNGYGPYAGPQVR